jgi:hypothetical protein
LCILLLAALCGCRQSETKPALANPAPQAVWLVDLRGRTLEEKVAAFVAQGIANRRGPRVFVRLGDECRWMQMFDQVKPHVGTAWGAEDAQRLRAGGVTNIEDAWVAWLTKKGVCRFVPVSLEALLANLGTEVKGAVLYETVKEDLAPAVTLAGLEDALPVTPALAGRWKAAGISLPTVFDYTQVRKGFGDRQDKRLAGHQWLIDNALPRCRKDGAVSRVRLYGADAHDTIVDIDQAAQNKWAVYELDHTALTNRTHGATLKADPPDTALLDNILSHLEPFSAVYGWGNPGEDSFIRSLNRHALVGECSGVPNNSFFAALHKAPYYGSKPFEFKQKRPHRRAEEVTVEGKIYVAFLVNEGDSIKTMNAFQGFGAWLQDERGKIPINWGIEPNLCVSHPALMAYYYETATTNDYFFSPPSGWGYTHPGFLPQEKWMAYAEKVKEGMALTDTHFIDIWWLGELRQRKQLDAFMSATGAWGLTDWDNSQQRMVYRDGGVTIAKSHHYYTYKTPAAEFAEKLIAETREVEGPWFVVIYGAEPHGTPHRFYELARRLPPERFKVVALDEFFAAAEKARPRVEGRMLKPGVGMPKGVAP